MDLACSKYSNNAHNFLCRLTQYVLVHIGAMQPDVHQFGNTFSGLLYKVLQVLCATFLTTPLIGKYLIWLLTIPYTVSGIRLSLQVMA